MPARSRSTEPLYRIKADLFKCLAHPARIQVLEVLAADGTDVSVARLLHVTGCMSSQLSQHLAVLREDGLVQTRRDGQTIYYSLVTGPAQRILDTLHGIYCSVGPSSPAKAGR